MGRMTGLPHNCQQWSSISCICLWPPKSEQLLDASRDWSAAVTELQLGRVLLRPLCHHVCLTRGGRESYFPDM